MSVLFDRLIDKLEDAKEAATLENASFGFPDDRIEIKSVHFGDKYRGHVGDIVHPDEYVKNITKLHHGSWIVAPLSEVIEILTVHRDVINEAERILSVLNDAGIPELASLLNAGKEIK
jgi:hypothetical protein